MFLSRKLVPLSLVLAVGVSLSAHAADYVTCESFKDKRAYCDVYRAYDAEIYLSRRLSDSPCSEGYSWGTDDRGVWVDHGCRAEFAVRRGRRDDYDRDRRYDDRRDRDYSRHDYERENIERERLRLEEERLRLEREKLQAAQPTLAPFICPPGTHPSTHRCTKEERKRGCKDYGAHDGSGRGCSNF